MRSSTHEPDNRTFAGRQSFAIFSTVAAQKTKPNSVTFTDIALALSPTVQEGTHTFGQRDIIHDLNTQLE